MLRYGINCAFNCWGLICAEVLKFEIENEKHTSYYRVEMELELNASCENVL